MGQSKVLPCRAPWWSPVITRLLFISLLTYSFGNINHSSFRSSGSLASVLRNKSPEFVEVDYLSVESVLLPVVMFHSFLPIVPRMTRQRTLSKGSTPKLTISPSWFFHGAYHRRYLYHLDVFCVCRLYRDRGTHDPSYVSSSSVSISTTRTLVIRRFSTHLPFLNLD